VANWSGQWPGLVGMLNLNACLRKSGVPYTTLWSKDFKDPLFKRGLHAWIQNKSFQHDASQVHDFSPAKVGVAERALALHWPSNCAPGKRSSRSSTRAAWAWPTPWWKTH